MATTVGAALLAASSIAISVATPLSAAYACASDASTYTVRTGDGWLAIADRADVGVRALLDANGAALDDLIVPGDRLCLPPGADPAADCDGSHVVRPGGSWYAIAARYDVDVTALLRVNDAVLTQTLFAGQTLCLPAGAKIGGSPAAPSTTPTTQAPAESKLTYTVRPGDGWLIIADRVKVRASDLLRLNGATLRTVIFPGRELRLPAGAELPEEPEPGKPTWVELQAAPTQGPCWFHDTWRHLRSGGRRHVGVDIFTVPGEYVYAVADGRLTGRHWDGVSIRAGNAWYLTADNGDRFYYAHLKGFAPNLSVGSRVEAGQIIGWVGATGNTTYPHLHFEIHPGGGEPVNPYPIVRAQGACKYGEPYTQPGGWIPD